MWRNSRIVDLDRTFLDTNGVRQTAAVTIPGIDWNTDPFEVNKDRNRESLLEVLGELNVCSQKGLVEMFDASIGSSTMMMPYGGTNQLSESEASVHKLPVMTGSTKTCSLLSYGFNPAISSWSPYHGSIYAVVSSISRLVASGGKWRSTRLSFQEYFKRLGAEPENWGLPFSALLGALSAQEELDIPAIGGKDSMSGTFHDIHVPPTLISFAVTTSKTDRIRSSEFKKPGNFIYYLPVQTDEFRIPLWNNLKKGYDFFEQLSESGSVLSASTVKEGGIAAQLFRMAAGNGIGCRIDNSSIPLFDRGKGEILFESSDRDLCRHFPGLQLLGETAEDPVLDFSDFRLPLSEASGAWKAPLDHVFPDDPRKDDAPVIDVPVYVKRLEVSKSLKSSPRVFIPVFPGTNCEYDTERAFREAGAVTDSAVFCNRSRSEILESLDRMVLGIKSSQILMLSGGFSAGDEPEGSGKFIANVLLNPAVSDAVHDLLERDGLILGICNGFQALVKSGLLPYGRIRELDADSPTLARNINNRHISRMVTTKVSSVLSPWVQEMNAEDLHSIAISHGEGRFTAPEEVLNDLVSKGQVVFQYSDDQGISSMNPLYNPNGSDLCIEGITSSCGKILGKMGHTERFTGNNFINIPGEKYQPLFRSGVRYFN